MAITGDVAVVSPRFQNNSEGRKTASTVQNEGSVQNNSPGFSMSCGDGKLIQAKEQTWTNDDKENCRVPVYKGEQIAEKFGKARTEEMNSCMGELSLSSPKERESGEKRKTRSRSRSCSPKRKSNTRSLSSSSSSMSRSSSSSSSDSDRSTYSRRRSRSRSRSRGRYRSFRTYRRRRSVPRSSSRSRSRSYPRCCRSRSRSHSSGRHYRFFYKCRSHYRSYRSRSYHRRYRSRSRSRSWTRGKRYNGFVQTGRERFVDGSNRNPSRSPSRPAVRLTEKDKLKLLEIAKANASKLLGVENVEVPASIKAKVQVSPDINSMKGELNAGHDEKLSRKLEDFVVSREKSPKTKDLAFSPNNSVAKPTTAKLQSSPVADSSTLDKKYQYPYGHWKPVNKEASKNLFTNMSPNKSLVKSR